MKSKTFNPILFITSLFGYLEWGQDNNISFIQGEMDIISKLISDSKSVLHLLILNPLLCQILLIIALFQKLPGKKLSIVGLVAIAILFLLMLVIGF